MPHLYYYDAVEGIDIYGKALPAEFYVDVSSEIEFKAEMLSHHASQREWLRAQHGMDDYINSMRSWAAARGAQASASAGGHVAYAEAFRQHRGHGYPRTNLLAEILGDRVIMNLAY